MAEDIAHVTAAERVQRRRARLFPVLGTLLIVANAALLRGEALSMAGAAGWVCVFLGSALLVLSGGLWPGRLRRLAEDETGRANRRWGVVVGYIASFSCACGLYVASLWVSMTAHEALQIVLTTAVGAPLIAFGITEQHSLGDGG